MEWIQRNNTNEIARLAHLFFEINQSFVFFIADKDGDIIYATRNADTSSNFDGDFYYVVHNDLNYSIIAQSRTGLDGFYQELIVRGAVVFAVVLILSIICAYIFTHQMTKPIKRLAKNAGKMARLEDVPREPKRLILWDTVVSVLPTYQTLAEAAGQNLSVDIPKETVVWADSYMLKKVFSNVVLNAVQNAPSDAAVRIWSEFVCGHCRLFVLNVNTHIDDEILTKLFDPFYRADKARTRRDKRSGLGLTIVQKTLQAMNAEFSLENTSEGVLFWVDLMKA